MHRLIKILISIILIVCFFVNSVYAYDADGHDKIMCRILFGEEIPSNIPSKESDKLQALKYASYLCLDQFNDSGLDELRFLNTKFKVDGIIKDINKINFSYNSHHRRYTHRGWDFKYPDDRAHWKLRKTILLNTVNKVFDYGNNMFAGIIGYNKKCNAMASLIYYIHIFGDYYKITESKSDYEKYKDNDNKDPDMLPLYKETDDQNVINEIEANLISLFSTQKKDIYYSKLFTFELPEIKKGFVDENDYKTYCSWCEKLYDVLSECVPELMKENESFKKAFYQ